MQRLTVWIRSRRVTPPGLFLYAVFFPLEKTFRTRRFTL
nr:MAG TPA_asm: hypothetical protein [Caudoviricetes sp.]